MKKIFSVLPIVYSFLIISIPLSPNNGANIVPYLFEKGEEFYQKGDYQAALEAFHKAMDAEEFISQRYPWVYFKIGFCQYKTAEYQNAIQTFENSARALQLVNDYAEYFLIKSKLALQDTASVIGDLNNFANQYPTSPIIPLIDSLRADIYFQLKNFDLASLFYRKQLKYSVFDKGDIYAKLIEIAKLTGNKNEVESMAFKLIDKYPFHPQSQSTYEELLRIIGSRIPESKFRALFDYVEETRQFEKAERLLRFQAYSIGETELIHWLRIKLLYEREEYQESLQASIEQRKSFSQLRYLRNIDLNIARCYLRLGYVANSIQAYALFQQRYPRDFLSPEVLWKIAWLHEELRNYSQAREYYNKLIMTYPRSQFVSEARFRIGLSYFRGNEIRLARITWQKCLSLEKSIYERPRYQYWIAKTYLKEKDFVNYLRELNALTDTPFISYYNLKAFLLTSDDNGENRVIDSLLWEMHHDQISHLGEYVDVLQKPLVVQDILGNGFARYELNNHLNNHNQAGWQYRFALAELQEKVGNYGKAYRLFRNVYGRHFSRKEWADWVFLFKRLYPFYFNSEVTQNAEKRNLTPEIIWAIIKKESAFAAEVVSYANAHGLMQIIPRTARQIADELDMEFKDIRLLYEPAINVDMGTYYITELLKRYEWNLYYALAAYNAGPHRVDRWKRIINTSDDDFFLENIEFSQTRGYVRAVMQYYWTYYLILHPQEIPDDVFSFPKKLAREPWYNEMIRN